MNKMLRKLKMTDRTILEVSTAILFWTLCLTLAILIVPAGGLDKLAGTIRFSYPAGATKAVWNLNLWIPSLLAFALTVHMKRKLDAALEYDGRSATTIIFRGYLFRYLLLALIAILASRLDILSPVVLILAYVLFMKAAVYSQPLSHKLYNRLFHEEDPVPHALEEESDKQ